MDIVQKITAAIEPSLAAQGYALVQVKLADGGGRKTLSIMGERADGQPMGVEDCTQISRTVSALLDVEDPISTAYDLEVCSPGIDRPLTKLNDFVRFTGAEAKVETMIPLAGQRKFRGQIAEVKGEEIILKMPEGGVKIAFSNIRSAKLMLSDALIKKKK